MTRNKIFRIASMYKMWMRNPQPENKKRSQRSFYKLQDIETLKNESNHHFMGAIGFGLLVMLKEKMVMLQLHLYYVLLIIVYLSYATPYHI